MAENNNNIPECFKEAVCIDAGRVYDSCCDKDCLEDLRCYFTAEGQSILTSATSVRARSAEVAHVYVDVEPVNFNRGYYACDLTFFFLIDFDVFTLPHRKPTCIKGVAVYSKKVILFGSEGNVKIFSNLATTEGCSDEQANKTTNMPKCVVQVVDPIILSARLGEIRDCFECCCTVPRCVCDCIGGDIASDTTAAPTIYATLGLFSIVQLIRNVQMLIPVYDFCIPEKSCDNKTDGPCELFRRINFPTDDFYPPRYIRDNDSEDFGCGCAE